MTRVCTRASVVCRRSAGFTLIEMLLVVSIVMLLIGILLPALNHARSASRQVECGTRMKQLQAAVYDFSLDDEGRLPPMQRVVNGIEFSWRGLLFPYTAQTPDIFDCPAEAKQRYALGAFNNVGQPTAGETYIWSGIGAVNVHWNQGYRTFHPPFGRWDSRYPSYGQSRQPVCTWRAIEDGSQLILFGDGNSSYDVDDKLYYYPEDAFWIYKMSPVGGFGYNRASVPQMGGKREQGLERHGGPNEANYVFADGSVKLLDANDIPCNSERCWWDAKIDPH